MKTKHKRSRIILPVSILCLLFLALIWGSYFRQKAFNNKDAIQFAIEKNSNLAVALEQHAINTLHNADAVLQLVRIEYARDGQNLNLQKLLLASKSNRVTTAGVSIISNRGRLVMTNTNRSDFSVPDFSVTPFFNFHSTNAIDSLLISKPLLSETTGKAIIFVSRRLSDVKGNFSGVVALYMEPSAFTSFYAQAKLRSNDIISLISPDGITYARRTGTRESYGEDIHKSPLFAHVAQHTDSFYFANDAIKSIPSWFSYRKLKEYPIIATVGSSEHDILMGNEDRQLRTKIPRVVTSVLIILSSVLIAIILLFRQRTANRLAEDKERYERLLTEQIIAAQEREREWIGGELHDNVSQVLTTAKLYLEMASKEKDNPLIPRSMQLINSSIIEIRNLSHQLSSPTLGTRSLIDAIHALIETVGFSTKLLFEFDHSGFNVSLVMSQKLALYRILQEQLNNIIKHSGATRIRITLVQKDGQVLLMVLDNGKGFDNRTRSNGMGLNNITSRVKVFGGSVNIESTPQKGCVLRVAFPIISSAEDQSV